MAFLKQLSPRNHDETIDSGSLGFKIGVAFFMEASFVQTVLAEEIGIHLFTISKKL